MQGNRLIVNEIICGDYTFTEIRTIDGYILSSQPFVITIDTDGNIVSNTAITNLPTALNIFKVTHENNSPLTGASFYIKNWLGLNKISFTQNEDGIYRYDKDGDIEEIMVGENGKIIVYSLPIGNYWIEEHTAPNGYYSTTPIKITIDEHSTIDVPYVATVPNSEFVNLGLDRDKYYALIINYAIIFIFVCVIMAIRRRYIKLHCTKKLQ